MAVRLAEWEGVFTDGSWFYTRNTVPGKAVYGEPLVDTEHGELRRWDADRSKAAAYLKRGGRRWPFHTSASVLYLGAGTGTTVSHLADICVQGTIVAVEVSPRAFRDLLSVAEGRPNVIPVLGDASKPESYRPHVRGIDVLYQDVAQRDQVGIFRKNADGFLPSGGVGMLMVKARSIDVAAKPAAVYASVEGALRDAGFEVMDRRSLEPFEADHAALVLRRR